MINKQRIKQQNEIKEQTRQIKNIRYKKKLLLKKIKSKEEPGKAELLKDNAGDISMTFEMNLLIREKKLLKNLPQIKG